jgi:hypothetical protein
MLGFDDGDLDNAKDQAGKPIYRISEIPASTYPKLQPRGFSCFGSCSVKTAFVAAHLVYTKEWAQRSNGVGDLIRSKNAAQPTIDAKVAGKQ